MTNTITINRTIRGLPDKNKYGMYLVTMDDDDVRWINRLSKTIEELKSMLPEIVQLQNKSRKTIKEIKLLFNLK